MLSNRAEREEKLNKNLSRPEIRHDGSRIADTESELGFPRKHGFRYALVTAMERIDGNWKICIPHRQVLSNRMYCNLAVLVPSASKVMEKLNCLIWGLCIVLYKLAKSLTGQNKWLRRAPPSTFSERRHRTGKALVKHILGWLYIGVCHDGHR